MTALSKIVDNSLVIERSNVRLQPLPDDLTGHILVINPTRMNQRYARAKFQLFEASCGFGCKPMSTGKVMGTSLADNEKCYWRRTDFIGAISREEAFAILESDPEPETPVDTSLRDYMAIGPGVYAHGDTVKEACKRAGLRFGSKNCLVFKCHPESFVNDYGMLVTPMGAAAPEQIE